MALHIGTGGKGMLGFSLLPWQRSTQAAAFELDLTSGRSWRLRPEEDAAEWMAMGTVESSGAVSAGVVGAARAAGGVWTGPV
jgi:hypothetical protein